MAEQPERCPYLGLSYDRSLRTEYPNDEHRCFAKETMAPISTARQRVVCLGPGYRSCWRLPELERSVRPIRPIRPGPSGFALPPLGRDTRLLLAGGALLIVLLLAIVQTVAFWQGSASSPSSPAAVSTPRPGASDAPARAAGNQQSVITPAATVTDGAQSSPAGAISAPSPTPVPPTRTPTPSLAAGPSVHVVASGETLLVIAARYGVTLDTLMRANGLSNANQLSVGQKLIVPPATNR